MKYIINVTQKDIDEGKCRLCFLCPIALAVNRATGKDAFVGSERLNVTEYNWVELPLAARVFAWDFDEGRSVEPFSFEVELVERSVQEFS